MEQQTIERARISYTNAQRCLLLGVLGLGVLWDWSWHGSENWSYGLFWEAALALYLLLNWQRPGMGAQGGMGRTLKNNPMALSLAAAAAILCVLHAFAAEELRTINLLAIPASLLLVLAFSVYDVPKQREGGAALICVKAFFCWPFRSIGRFFGAIGSLFSGGTARLKTIAAGLGAGIPLTALVLWLLTSADAAMGTLIHKLFQNIAVGNWLLRGLGIVLVAGLFYSLLYRSAWEERASLPPATRRNWPGTALLLAGGMLILVYALFAYVQIVYLFGGRLPEGTTYSAYAREGFWQLIAVAAINFLVVGCCLTRTEQKRPVQILTGLLLLATALLLASALMRLWRYIGAYGLTMMRILPLWLMCYLAALTCLTAVRLFRQGMPLLRIAGLTMVFWYVALNFPPWETILSAYNAAL